MGGADEDTGDHARIVTRGKGRVETGLGAVLPEGERAAEIAIAPLCARCAGMGARGPGLEAGEIGCPSC